MAFKHDLMSYIKTVYDEEREMPSTNRMSNAFKKRTTTINSTIGQLIMDGKLERLSDESLRIKKSYDHLKKIVDSAFKVCHAA